MSMEQYKSQTHYVLFKGEKSGFTSFIVAVQFAIAVNGELLTPIHDI